MDLLIGTLLFISGFILVEFIVTLYAYSWSYIVTYFHPWNEKYRKE